MGHHLKDGKFKSDKYSWCPVGFFALKLTDPLAQGAALYYASSSSDKELSDDIKQAVANIRKEGEDGSGQR